MEIIDLSQLVQESSTWELKFVRRHTVDPDVATIQVALDSHLDLDKPAGRGAGHGLSSCHPKLERSTTHLYPVFKARAASICSAILSAQKTRANEVSELMTLPMTLLVLIFLVILTTPGRVGLRKDWS